MFAEPRERAAIMVRRSLSAWQHGESPLEKFLERYGEQQKFLEPAIRAFPPDALIA